jgi:hypothetical protein
MWEPDPGGEVGTDEAKPKMATRQASEALNDDDSRVDRPASEARRVGFITVTLLTRRTERESPTG